MTLTREQIERWRQRLVDDYGSEAGALDRDAAVDELDTLCDLALRALPLPEGEVKEIADTLEEGSKGYGCGANVCGDAARELRSQASTLSRQAASLATLEHVKLNAAYSDRIGELLMRAEAAEASLASAQRVIDDMEPRYRYACNYCHGNAEVCENVPMGGCVLPDYRRSLASPRQEEG